LRFLKSLLLESFVFYFTTKKVKVKIYRTKILPFVFFEDETWSLVFTENYRLREFQEKLLRKYA